VSWGILQNFLDGRNKEFKTRVSLFGINAHQVLQPDFYFFHIIFKLGTAADQLQRQFNTTALLTLCSMFGELLA